MKRIQYAAFGPASTFVLADTDEPSAGPGHLVVDVMAAGLNPLDFKVSSGLIPIMTGPDFPKGFGTDLAGIVTHIAADVSGFSIGDRVFGSIPIGASGAFAERAAIPAANTALLPDRISFDDGAALVIPGSAALQALIDTACITEGTRILINGAAGGVGTIAVQVANAAGAIVTATAAGAGLDLVATLGADEVIDYTTTATGGLGRRFDVVFDTVSTLSRSEADGLIVDAGHHINLNPGPPVVDDYHSRFTTQHTQMTAERLERVAALVAAGHVQAKIGDRFRLADAIDHLTRIEARTITPIGKAVMTQLP